MPRGDQLSRQWRLIQLIDRPQGITVDDAARDLAVTIRTIWRDVEVLQPAGFPLYTERAADGNRGVWRVTEAFKRALPLKRRFALLGVAAEPTSWADEHGALRSKDVPEPRGDRLNVMW